MSAKSSHGPALTPFPRVAGFGAMVSGPIEQLFDNSMSDKLIATLVRDVPPWLELVRDNADIFRNLTHIQNKEES